MQRKSSNPSPLRLILCVLALALASPARAEPNAAYEEAIRHAVEEYSLGHWAEAKVFFQRAHAVHPNARTLRGLGLTCYESRSYVEAIGHLQAALGSQVQPLTEAMRTNVVQLLTQAQQFVTRATLDVYPADAVITLDLAPHEIGANGELLLDPGDHEVSASAPGYTTVKRSVNATGGEVHVQLRLEPEVVPQPAAAEIPLASAPAAATAPEGPGIAPYVVIGASGAVAIAGGVLLVIAAGDKSAVESGAGSWPDDLRPRYDRARTFFPLGFTLAGVGIAGVAAGVAWKFWPREREAASLTLTPTGIALRGYL